MQYLKIGIKPYNEVLELQRCLHKARVEKGICDTVVFCEHPPVFTLGKRDCGEDIISDSSAIKKDGIEVIKTDRGGRITYHGPGQLVAYFIFDIVALGKGVKDFVNMVEEACLKTLARFGITAERDEKYPGLWIAGKKIAALGFHVSGGVTMHGIALNVAPNLSHYRHIIPCGIRERGITSMKEILRNAPPMEEVIEAFCQALDDSTDENVRRFSSSLNAFKASAFLKSSGRDFR